MNQLLLMTAVCLMATAILALPTQLKERSEKETLAKLSRPDSDTYECRYYNQTIYESWLCDGYCDCEVYCDDESDEICVIYGEVGLTRVNIGETNISMEFKHDGVSNVMSTDHVLQQIGGMMYYVCCSWWN